ncbi:MAG: ygfK, partial [Bacteroidetes bacterium]|nr:ygfK [Bacteroidota bacterium]
MAELVPIPFERLLKRIYHEYQKTSSIFDLPSGKFYHPSPGLDLSVSFCGNIASNPAGPAAGPQTQLTQNIVLSWLAGGRIVELKTVQVNDRLHLSRPCIDMATV